ncbi:hypothetical protein JW823_04900 [bacterium]|nr:hypothetical protein [candidate division CSSED10-310 bacterium]
MTRQKTFILLAVVLLLPVDHGAGIASGYKLPQIENDFQSRDRSIVFFGIVVDNNEHPVADAIVEIHYRHYSPKVTIGIDRKHITTDEAGRFTVDGIEGTELFINNISKFGYEFTYFDRKNFSYWDHFPEKVFKPDKRSPVKFMLRKKNPAALVFPGIVSKTFESDTPSQFYDAAQHIFWTKQIDGTPRIKDVKVFAVRDPLKEVWTLTFETLKPEDGLILSDKKLFTVPSSGFKSQVSVDVPVDPQRQPFHLYFKSRSATVYSGLDGTLRAWPERVYLTFDSRTNLNGNPNIDFYEEIYADYWAKKVAEQRRIREERKKKSANE